MDPEIKRLVCDHCHRNLFSPETFKVAWDASPWLAYTTPSWAEMQKAINFMCEWCDLMSDEILSHYHHIAKTRTDPPPDATFRLRVWFEGRAPTSSLRLKVRVEDGWTCTFQVFTTPEDIAAQYITERGVLDRLDAPHSYDIALQCIRNCEMNHPRCPPPTPTALPTRVIDCENLSSPKLFQNDGRTPPARYAALSYVWGEHQPHKTTTANFSTYLERIDPKYIPKTIRDAIKVTRALGLRYLWVDAYCIVQDSREDKARCIAQIRNIFRHSYITIIAANADKVSDGFLNRMLLYNTPGTVPFCCPDGSGDFGTMKLQYPENAPREPVNSRAWCLEERVLSTRALWYCCHTIQYECQSGHQNVDGEGNMSDPLDGVPRLPDRLFMPELFPPTTLPDSTTEDAADKEEKEVRSAWTNILGLYTRRTLTQPEDRLIALSGIVSYFADFWHGRSRYLAGLWEHQLPYSLLWYNKDGGAGIRDGLAARPAFYRAPSWSWAAVDGEIASDATVRTGATCTVQQCHAVPKRDSNPYGEVIAGMIVLKIALRRTVWDPVEAELYEVVDGVRVGVPDESRSERREIGYVAVDAAEELSRSTGEVYAAVIAKTTTTLLGIVVVPVASSELGTLKTGILNAGCTYRRVGWFTAPFCNKDDWLRTPQRLVNLV